MGGGGCRLSRRSRAAAAHDGPGGDPAGVSWRRRISCASLRASSCRNSNTRIPARWPPSGATPPWRDQPPEILGFRCLAGMAGGAHFLADRLPQPPAGDDQLGLGLFILRTGCAPDYRSRSVGTGPISRYFGSSTPPLNAKPQPPAQ